MLAKRSEARENTTIIDDARLESSIVPTVGDPARRWGLVVGLCGVAFAIYASLAPFNFIGLPDRSLWEWILEAPRRMTLATGRVDFFSNVCLFLPVGFGGMAWLTRDERSIRAIGSLIVLLALSGALSVSLELAQLLLPGRVSSHYDVWAQLLGTLAGALCWIVLGRRVRIWLDHWAVADQGSRRFELFLQAYLAVQVFWSVFPLDVSIDPADVYHKLQRGQINLVPFRGHDWTHELVLEMLYFSLLCIPYGALATRWRVPRPFALRSIPDSIALGVAIVAGIEFVQLFIRSRYSDATQLVLGSAGVVLGVAAMHALWPRDSEARGARWLQSPGTWFLAAIGGAGVPFLFLLWPFDFTFDSNYVKHGLTQMMEAPFESLLRSSPLSISTVLTRDVLLYLPMALSMGAAVRCADRVMRPALLGFGMMLIGGAAGAIEVLQTLIPERVPDIMNIWISSMAGVICMFLMAASPSRPVRTSQPSENQEGPTCVHHRSGRDGLS